MDWNTIINFLLIAGVVQGFVFNLVILLAQEKVSSKTPTDYQEGLPIL